MKFIAQLPDAKHYRRLQSEKIIFSDKGTPLLEIESPIENPWDREWVILLGIKKGGNKNITVAGKLRLKLLEEPPSSDIMRVKIDRTFAFGKFDYSPRNSIYHIGFPLSVINEGDSISTYKWLQYDLLAI